MPQFLIAQSELPDEREQRRQQSGKSSGETYAATLRQLVPHAEVTVVAPADADAPVYGADELARFDAVFLTGSPMHVYDDTPEVARQLAFMRAVFASGTPAFGSCAGLQVAVAAAGGSVRKMPERMEAGVARNITRTRAGDDHPLLAGRALCWDAASIHGDEVAELPPGATLLASSPTTRVQAVEIRHDRGVFWGVQYHPELSLEEVGRALRGQAAELVEQGLAEDEGDVAQHADLFDALNREPDRLAARWSLGVDAELVEEERRRRELTNFIRFALEGRAAAEPAAETVA